MVGSEDLMVDGKEPVIGRREDTFTIDICERLSEEDSKNIEFDCFASVIVDVLLFAVS